MSDKTAAHQFGIIALWVLGAVAVFAVLCGVYWCGKSTATYEQGLVIQRVSAERDAYKTALKTVLSEGLYKKCEDHLRFSKFPVELEECKTDLNSSRLVDVFVTSYDAAGRLTEIRYVPIPLGY